MLGSRSWRVQLGAGADRYSQCNAAAAAAAALLLKSKVFCNNSTLGEKIEKAKQSETLNTLHKKTMEVP